MSAETTRVVMVNWYADLSLRNGEVVPMRLWGGQVTDALTESCMTDSFVEQIEALFDGQWNNDNGGRGYHGPSVVAVETTANGSEVIRVVRRSEIMYATLRRDITEHDYPVK